MATNRDGKTVVPDLTWNDVNWTAQWNFRALVSASENPAPALVVQMTGDDGATTE